MSADCTVLAAMCVSRKPTSAFPNFKRHLVEEANRFPFISHPLEGGGVGE
jgi:hypothetical protein